MGASTPIEPSATDMRWYVPDWLDEAVALPTFEVIDTRSSQGRLDPRPKTVTIADLVLFHGHICDGLLRSAYALRALADVAFPGGPFDRTDLLVVSKNSPCLGDVAAYLTGGRARFGTHRIDDSLGVGFVVQQLSTGATWEVREEPGFFPPIIAAWDAAVLDDGLVDDGLLDPTEKAEFVSVNEAAQWDWVRTALLPSRPADHYVVTTLDSAELPDAMHDGRRTDTVNRDVAGPRRFPSTYEDSPAAPGSTIDGADDHRESWRERYLGGPPRRP